MYKHLIRIHEGSHAKALNQTTKSTKDTKEKSRNSRQKQLSAYKHDSEQVGKSKKLNDLLGSQYPNAGFLGALCGSLT
jgi:hypothetical protein